MLGQLVGCLMNHCGHLNWAQLQIRALHLWLMVLLIDGGGCGDRRPARVPVSGTVLIDGAAVTRGSIKFVPEHGRPFHSAKSVEDGRFTLTCYDGKRRRNARQASGAGRSQTGSSVKERWSVCTQKHTPIFARPDSK